MKNLTLKQAALGLEKGDVSSVKLTKYYLDRIKKIDKDLNSFLLVTDKLALKAAKVSDDRRAKGKSLGILDGIPYALKDVFCTKGIKTTAASKILKDFIPPYNSTVYNKLKAQGAVMLGKTNTDEFTMGSSTENSAFKTTKNPWDKERVPGGSSGGSAAAVAADLCIFALGTDTGGSIRQPASYCGIIGLKVSYGLISRFGVISYASSFDTIGPLCKTVEDAAIIIKELAGQDYYDSTTIPDKALDYIKSLNSKDLKGKTIGLPKEFMAKGINPEVKRIIKKTAKLAEKLGAKVEEMSLPSIKQAIAVYYILAKSEASSNLARYDGIRYGYSLIKQGKKEELEKIYSLSREQGFGDEAKRSIMLGTYTLSAGYFDAYYKKAAQIRTLIKQEFEQAFKKYDILLTPVAPMLPFKINEKLDNPLQMYLADVNTVPINVAGVPAISLPIGLSKNNLPIGVQLIGPIKGEGKILDIGQVLEQEINFKQKPKIL